MRNDTRIISVKAFEAYSDRMQAAIEVIVETGNGKIGKALISPGLSVGSHEGKPLYDGGKRFGGKGVLNAVRNINEVIAPKLVGLDSANQFECDEVILSCGKEKMGTNAVAAVSTAVLFAGANSTGVPLYEHIGGVRAFTLPVPAALAASGSNRYENPVQCGYKPTYCFVAYDFNTYTDASKALWEVYMAWYDLMVEKLKIKMQPIAGMAIPQRKIENDYLLWDLLKQAIDISGYTGKVGLQVDLAANCFYDREKMVYSGLFERGERTRQEQIEMIVSMASEYPFVIIEDPLMDDDFEGFAEITARTDIQITCDDLIASDINRLKTAIRMKAGNALRLVTSQVGTFSEITRLALEAEENNFGIVPCGERGEGLASCDYAVGLNAGSAHEYGMCYSGNRLLQIESELGRRARFFASSGIRGNRFQLQGS